MDPALGSAEGARAVEGKRDPAALPGPAPDRGKQPSHSKGPMLSNDILFPARQQLDGLPRRRLGSARERCIICERTIDSGDRYVRSVNGSVHVDCHPGARSEASRQSAASPNHFV